jgi:ribonuclease III
MASKAPRTLRITVDEKPATEKPENTADALLSRLEDLLQYRFHDPGLLLRALTHRSYVNDHEAENLQHNESMEFLGDAVFGFLISATLYRSFPNLTEGELSKTKAYLVSAANLLRLAERMHLGDYLRLSRGEEKTGGRTKRAIVADALEAVVGAIYLDGGIQAASEFVERQIGEELSSLNQAQLTYGDFKSALQEQLHNLGSSEPVYQVVGELGPDHKKVFVVQVLVGGKVIAEGAGKTKKEAQQAAAQLALDSLETARKSDGS